MDMYRLAEDFDLESDLRRKLKAIKVELDYEELAIIDTSEYEDNEDNENEEITGSSGIIFEIGKTVLKTEEFSASLIRIKIQ